jgi:iron complex transport system ATP-binding protein
VLGLLPQSPIASDGITVADLVSRGALPTPALVPPLDRPGHDPVARALDATGTAELVDRPIRQLSGGQRQRVWVAMALAQDTDLLLLEVVTTGLVEKVFGLTRVVVPNPASGIPMVVPAED